MGVASPICICKELDWCRTFDSNLGLIKDSGNDGGLIGDVLLQPSVVPAVAYEEGNDKVSYFPIQEANKITFKVSNEAASCVEIKKVGISFFQIGQYPYNTTEYQELKVEDTDNGKQCTYFDVPGAYPCFGLEIVYKSELPPGKAVYFSLEDDHDNTRYLYFKVVGYDCEEDLELNASGLSEMSIAINDNVFGYFDQNDTVLIYLDIDYPK